MCDIAVAVGTATRDGSIIVAKNSDGRSEISPEPFRFSEHEKKPEGSKLMIDFTQLPEEYGVKNLKFEIPEAKEIYKTIGHGAMSGWEEACNEYGVAIVNVAAFSREPLNNESGIPTWDILKMAVQRSKTAYEAMHLIGTIAIKYGQSVFHSSYICADPNEAWVIETATTQWVAKKVKDIAWCSNQYQIEDDWDESSPDVVEHAIKMGWIKRGEPFSWREVYSDPQKTVHGMGISSEPRYQSGINYLTERKGDITIWDMRKVLSSHYEGTIFYHSHVSLMAPRTICTHSSSLGGGATASSAVIHLRKDVPDMISTVYWGSFASPCTGVFIPYYVSMDPNEAVPNGFKVATFEDDDPNSAWWRFHHLRKLCEENYVRNGYIAKSVWSDFEKKEDWQKSQLDREVTALIEKGEGKEARDRITKFVRKKCDEAWGLLSYLEDFLKKLP